MGESKSGRDSVSKHGAEAPNADGLSASSEGQARRSREATTARILDAAQDLFSHRDPQNVTVREIAQKAGVTHALVHQYVGSKDEILNAVVVREAPSRQKIIAEHPDLREVIPLLVSDVMARRLHTRSVIRTAMDGVDYASLEDRIDTGRMLAELAAREAASGRIRLPEPESMDPGAVMAAVIALVYGWVAVGDWLVDICGLPEDDPAAVQRQLIAIASHLAELVYPRADESD